MPRMSDFPFRFIHFSPGLLGDLPGVIKRSLKPLLDAGSQLDSDTAKSLVVVKASEILKDGERSLPEWADAETHYLVFNDIPEPALLRLPTILRIHKPDQRIHATRDVAAIKREAIALNRDHAFEGLIDAYLVQTDLVVVHGDLTVRAYPLSQLDFLSEMNMQEVEEFTIHTSGSFLEWPAYDLRVGASQFLQAVDPMFLADIAIERYSAEKMSLALRALREEAELTQSEIPGLSDRHIRRLENEEIRFTADAAAKYAEAFGFSLHDFLERLARMLTELSDPTDSSTLDPGIGKRLRHAG